MTSIHDIDTTVKAIIQQGEGSIGESRTLSSRIQVFQELYEEHPLIWYLVVENQDTESFKSYMVHKVRASCYAMTMLIS
jgi:hypothetical protein